MRPMKTTLSRPFKLLTPDEAWIFKIVEPFREKFLSSASLWCPLQPQSGSVANLIAILKHPRSEEDKEKNTPKLPDVVKEIVVFRSPPTLHVYDVYEYGRRYFRTISYTSDTSHCLHDLVPRVKEVSNPQNPYILSGGHPTRMTKRTQSLVITRNITASVGVQKFIPNVFLAGLVPSALLERYTFWQSEDLSLTGYEKSKNAAGDRTLLRIKLRPHKKADTTGFCNSRAYGCIRRYTVLNEIDQYSSVEIDKESDDQTPSTPDIQARRVSTLLRLPPRVDTEAPRLTMLNLLYVDQSNKFLCSLRKLLKRLDSLSHVLVWSSSPGTVDLVELPRLRLRFKVAKVSTSERDAYDDTDQEEISEYRLWSEEHAGLFVSNQRSPRLKSLLQGLPHSVLLQNVAGDLFVILPSTAKPFRTRTNVPGAAVTSRCTKHWKPVDSWRPIALDRRDPKWIRNLGPVRHYIYEIHESKTFLLASTLSSALYLLLFRFAHHQYEAVCRIASSIVSDTVLSSEEAQLWGMLSNFADDVSPNAHASRLRLWLATRGCRSNTRSDRDVVLYLINKFNNRFGYQLGGDPDDESITSERRWEKLKKQNPDVIESLRVAIRAVKWKLRGLPSCELRAPKLHDGIDFTHIVTRAQFSDLSGMRCPWSVQFETAEYVRKRSQVFASCRLNLEEELGILEIVVKDTKKLSSSSSRHVRNRLALLKAYRNGTDKVVDTELPPYGVEEDTIWFDGLLDRSCIQPTPSSFLKSFSRLNYNRPIQSDKDGKELSLRGVAASVSVDEWLQKGIRLSGSKNKLGFLFLYELLTESIDIAMLATDKSYQLGYFLTRMLPLKNTQNKSATMSILRVLCSNPKLCPRFPKFEKKRSWFMVQGQISEFLKMAQKFVADSDAKGEVFWARKSPVPVPQRLVNVMPWKSNARSRREFFTSYILDFNRQEVPVRASGDDLTSEKIRVFSQDPLCEIRERHCTFKSRSQRGLQSVCEDMPFDMSNHKSAKSSIAKDLLRRVANDVKTFAISANGKEEAGIKGFSAKQCESMAKSGSRSSALST